MFKHSRWPIHADDEINAVAQVLHSGKTNYWTGHHGREFEKEYAEYVGTRHAVLLMNGTVALEAALYALDIGPGDEVITSCRTFIASASAIVMRGATPIVADVDLDSQNITAETIEPCITPKTKAIIVVHLAGWPAEMESIMRLANKYHLKVIEDCAQAHGARIQQKAVGSLGDIAAFSFCQDKIMTTGGEGGMLTTNDAMLWEKIWSYKDHGKNYEKMCETPTSFGFRWVHDSFGTNWRMTEMQAAIGRLQLKKLPHWLQLRKRNADILTEHFKTAPLLRLTIPPVSISHAFYKYYVFIRPEMLKKDWHRDRIVAEINKMGVTCYVGSCHAIDEEKAFIHLSHLSQVKPNAKKLGETSLMFLVHPSLSELEMSNMAKTAIAVFDSATQ